MVFNMKVNLPEDARTVDFYTRVTNSSDGDLTISSKVRLTLMCPISMKRLETPVRTAKCLHLEAVDLNSLIHLLPFKDKANLKQDSAACIQCPICRLSGPLLKDGIILKFLEDFKGCAVEIDEKGLAVPVEQEKSEIIDLTESFNSSCCLSEGELGEGEIKSPVKRTKNGSSLSKSRSSFQLNSEPRKLTKIISAPNLTTKSILKGKSVNIATLLKVNQSKSKVKRLGSTSRTLKALPCNITPGVKGNPVQTVYERSAPGALANQRGSSTWDQGRQHYRNIYTVPYGYHYNPMFYPPSPQYNEVNRFYELQFAQFSFQNPSHGR